ncbi:uncharacterized protein LOC114258018 isoform X7 [Camellia sinensis]|uniref:uncharacterized protein LOC114258018 isoform X7 n=1 Tax=Camellia sinensis TaxID=4442 RepID=UPI001035C20B|nr:uncharacterized protein LOC114258018 isoform X7 [Camellia sinensis]
MNDPNPKYTSPNPAQGYYQGPPVMAPPQHTAPPPPRSQPGWGVPRGTENGRLTKRRRKKGCWYLCSMPCMFVLRFRRRRGAV